MNQRRGFLRNVGFLSLFGSGAALAQVSPKDKTKQAEIESVPVKELESNHSNIIFQSKYGELDESKSIFTRIGDDRYKPETLKKVEVTLKVGPDGKLYVKENDIWRKI